jgi:hypothetical protein
MSTRDFGYEPLGNEPFEPIPVGKKYSHKKGLCEYGVLAKKA